MKASAEHLPEFNFTNDEVNLLCVLISQLHEPHQGIKILNSGMKTVENSIHKKWDDLSSDQKELLIVRYGEPTKLELNVNLLGTTSGAACIDNERALPSGVHSTYSVIDSSLCVFPLYDDHDDEYTIQGKTRVISAGLVIGANGQVILPDHFYTFKSPELRAAVVHKMNEEGPSSRVISFQDLYRDGAGAINSSDINLTLYRPLGTLYIWLNYINEAELGRRAMKVAGLSTNADTFEEKYPPLSWKLESTNLKNTNIGLGILRFIEDRIKEIVELNY
jgi:hypothetical protein